MLSGLQRSGAIPLLALVIFSLFSLVPSLSQQWDLYHWKFRRISYLNSEVHDIPPALGDSVDRLSRSQAISGRDEPRPIHASQRNNNARQVSVAEQPGLQSSADAVVVATKPNHNTATTDSPRPLTVANRMRSFRSFFSKERIALRSAQTPQPQPVPVRPSSQRPAIAASGSSVDGHVYPAQQWNSSTSGKSDAQEKTPLASELPARLGGSWQPVCQIGIDVVNWLNSYSSRKADCLKLTHHRHASESTDPSKFSKDTHGSPPAMENVSNPVSDAPHNLAGQPLEKSVTAVEDSTDAALGRNSHQMRGSIMAIVVGLVVGIIWF